jgi:hypothetical protein
MESTFPSNSSSAAKPEAPKKKIEKVTTGEVIQRKKPLGKRFRETFAGDDSKSVGSYVFFDVIVPGTKDILFDVATEGVSRLLFGESRTRRGHKPNVAAGLFGQATYNAYNRYASPTTSLRPQQQAQPTGRPRGRVAQTSYSEIILASRAEANEVLDQMIAIISQYGTVSVSDLFELVGHTGEFTDEKWGWSDLLGADVQRLNEGYLLNLPKPSPLD